MAGSAEIVAAVGGVFLVTWYGFARLARSNVAPGRITVAPPAYRDAARRALAAEFHDQSELVEHFPGGSVYCPDCRCEFPAGVLYCECGTETVEVEDLDDAFDSHGDSDSEVVMTEEKLVCVHIAENPWQASVLKSFLESHDIPCSVGGNAPIGTYAMGPLQQVRILVRAAHAERARVLLTEHL